jgi:hypothetical protein
MTFGLFFSILVVAALVGVCGEIFMRVRLTRRATYNRIAWWRRGGDEVADTYEQLFPGSLLPRYRRNLFWIVLALAVPLFLIVLLKSR